MTRRIVTIDCEYLRPEFAAAYLLIDGDHAAFIDNNTAHSVPRLLETLQREGLSPAQVDFVIITHVHLDHAGGTSQLMKACPRATLLAHPRAIRHMVDPSRLVASARHVYGDEAFDRMYGLIEPIEASRIRAVEDDESIPFGRGAPLRFFHTRGHANHHFCIHEPDTASVFTGDAFGLAYPALQRSGLFVFPSTSPTDFDHAEAIRSIDRILATGARQAWPTHFGAVTDLPRAARQLREFLGISQDILESAAKSASADSELGAVCEEELRAAFGDFARRQGLTLTPADWELVRLDLELNAQGLAHVAVKSRRP